MPNQIFGEDIRFFFPPGQERIEVSISRISSSMGSSLPVMKIDTAPQSSVLAESGQFFSAQKTFVTKNV
jgi:hypothetical protein